MEIKLTVPGNPIPKIRARYSSKDGYFRTYDPQTDKKLEVINYLKSTNIFRELTEIPSTESIFISLIFYLPVCKSASQNDRIAKLWGMEPCSHKPDLDNLIKFYSDCLNTLFYKDDCQISFIYAKKRYSENPRTEITIMKNEKISYTNNTLNVLKQFTPQMMQEFISEMRNFRGMPFYDFDDVENITKAPMIEAFAEKICYFAEKYSDALKNIKKNISR